MERRGTFRSRAGLAFAALLAGAFAVVAMLGTPSPAGAAPGIVVKPRPGQEVTRHPFRFIVRAGPETGDLVARLNGKQIGTDFLVGSRGRRVLSISNSHGLRHGRNTFKVTARTHHGTVVRRKTVHFTVVHKRPMAGAGRDRRIAEGRRVKLAGRVRESPKGPSGDRVRWKLVHAPRGSSLRPGAGSRRIKAGGFRGTTSLHPSFTPDVNGTYTLKMTAGTGKAQTSDQVNLQAVPAQPLVELHTRVTDPASGRPAIQVGSDTYVAPYMQPDDRSYVDFPQYLSLLQALILDRSTLELIDNRTYGVCRGGDDPDPTYFTCRQVGDRPPEQVPMDEELLGETPGALVIVSSLVAGVDANSLDYARVMLARLGPPNLRTIGFPSGSDPEIVTPDGSTDITDELEAAPPDSLSLIGVPGMKSGEADYSVIGEASSPSERGMNGWLIPDQNVPAHYGFVSPERVPFNTRSKPDSCNSGGCAVTATIGDETLTHKVRTGDGEFLVAAYEPHTLERQGLEYFLTGSDGDGHPGDTPIRAADMADFLKKWGNAGSLILISSIQAPHGGPKQTMADAGIPQDTWRKLSDQVAAVGGTATAFNTAADTAGSDYSLIGFGGAGEGGGQETVGGNMGIRGVLARDDQMRFRPANATDVGTPSELLTTETLKAPGSKPWPYADDAGVTAAMSYIGARTSQLGPDPRTAYWANHMSESSASGFIEDITPMKAPDPVPNSFTSEEFDTAKAELLQELGYVRQVRHYLGELAAPSAAGADTWPTVSAAAEKLDKALGEPKSELKREIADRGLLVNFLDIASVAAGGVAEDAETILYSASAGLELGFDVEAEEDGSAVTSPSLAADEAAGHIHDRLDHISRSFEGLGDVIVSDYAKLQLIGKYGGCNDLQTQCPSGLEQLGYENPATAEALVDLAVKQSVYETVVPYYFPVADMGLSYSCGVKLNFEPTPCSPDEGPDPYTQYSCGGDGGGGPPPDGPRTPFGDGAANKAPKDAWHQSLEILDPAANVASPPPSTRIFHTWLAVNPVGGESGPFGWLPQDVLDYMFGAIDKNDLGDSPLQISPGDWMRETAINGPDDDSGLCGNWAGITE